MPNNNPVTDLVFKKTATPLTKKEQQFNLLVKKITIKEQEIATLKNKIDDLNNFYYANVFPFQKEASEQKIALAQQMAELAGKVKLSKTNKKKVFQLMKDLCNSAFATVEPTDEQIAFYNQFSQVSFEEEAQQLHDYEAMMMDMSLKMAGINISMQDYEKTEAGKAQFMTDLQAKVEELESTFSSKNEYKERKKSQKQLAAEAAKKQIEETRHKSLRSIYINLAKLLHPDAETDHHLKIEKEEWMKKVTLAYEQKDLITLLRIENQWIHQQGTQINKLSTDTLDMYIHFLKERYNDLNEAFFDILNNLENEEIENYLNMPDEKAKKQMTKEIIKPIQNLIKNLNEDLSKLKIEDLNIAKALLIEIAQDHWGR